MAQRNAQKMATKEAPNVSARAAELRTALGRPSALRAEAERLLDHTPAGCDLLAWSPEGYNVALVASVIADENRRSLTVHRASLIAPLAPRLREEPWRWVSVEELLGLGGVRGWATAWATAHGGKAYRSAVPLALAP
jgi:hypothetical protein